YQEVTLGSAPAARTPRLPLATLPGPPPILSRIPPRRVGPAPSPGKDCTAHVPGDSPDDPRLRARSVQHRRDAPLDRVGPVRMPQRPIPPGPRRSPTASPART